MRFTLIGEVAQKCLTATTSPEMLEGTREPPTHAQHGRGNIHLEIVSNDYAPFLRDVPMKGFMTGGTKGDKILLAIITQEAAKLNMMNLQLACPSTILASPIISF
jgi:hypothetical protein